MYVEISVMVCFRRYIVGLVLLLAEKINTFKSICIPFSRLGINSFVRLG